MATFDAESKWLACMHACLVVVANDIIFLINLYEHFCIQSVLIFMLMNFKRMVKGQCPIMKALHAMDIHVHTHIRTVHRDVLTVNLLAIFGTARSALPT